MSAMKELYTEAVEEFHKWEDEKYGDKTPLADMHVDMWVEAYMLGYVNATKEEEVPKDVDMWVEAWEKKWQRMTRKKDRLMSKWIDEEYSEATDEQKANLLKLFREV